MTGGRGSYVDDRDPLALGSVGLLHKLAEVIRVARQQDHRAGKCQGSRRHYRIDSASVPRQSCHPQKFAGTAPKLRGHRMNGGPRQDPMYGSVARTAP